MFKFSERSPSKLKPRVARLLRLRQIREAVKQEHRMRGHRWFTTADFDGNVTVRPVQ